MSNGFLTIDAYPWVEKMILNVFRRELLLPAYIFKKKYRFTILADFTYVLDKGLIGIMNERHFCKKTDKILLSVLAPDPIVYFYKHFGKINSFCFNADISYRSYMDLLWLDPGNRADAVRSYHDTVVWIPDNNQWAIWGERDRDIAVIGFDDPAQADFLLNEDGYWIDAETALEDFASAPYRGQKAPEDFARPLIENYGSRKDLERKLEEAGVRPKPGTWADE